MTTLRRLMVADYPIRVLVVALAVLGVTADVRAQSPIRVGYYDMNIGAGATAEQEPPIVAAGFTPVQLSNVTATDLAGLHVLFVQNSSPNAYGTEYLASKAAVQDAVNAGLVLIIHDRFVGPSPAMTRNILPLPAGVMPVATRVNSQNNSVTDPATFVANGPGGIVTELNLDNGMNSNMGFVNLSTVTVVGRVGLIHTGNANNSVTFSYPFGQGFVIYSSIPLDMFLKNMGTATQAVKDAFRNIYAPNVLAYAACGLKAVPATLNVTSATGHYGGTTTLTATVKCGGIPASGVTINFSLNGTSVDSAVTDSSGTATLVNASLGSSPALAIPVGSYAAGVSAAFAGTTLHGASSGTAALTVEKAPASIGYEGGTFDYDAAPHAAIGTVTGVFGEPLGVPSFTYTDDHDVTTDVAPVNAGTYKVAASVTESANYLGTSLSSNVKIKIKRASLVVTADNKTKLYGAALPSLTGTYQGFAGNDGPTVLGGMLQLTTNATVASQVDEYDIKPSGVTSDNYDITFVKSVLAVTPASLTVRAENATKTYGAHLPDFTATYDGFVLGETAEALDGALHFETDASTSSVVGTYTVTSTGLKSNNYAIAFVDARLTVTPASLTVRADNKNKVYGAALPMFTARYEGFVLGETASVLGGTLAIQTNATITSHVGRYPVTPSGVTSINYNITFAAGFLSITPAPLKIRAEDKERLGGLLNPLLTVAYEGFVLADSESSLDERPKVSTPAQLLSPDGEYPILVRGAADADYAIEHINGTLTLSPEGRMHGAGAVETGDARHKFDFGARETLIRGEKGSLRLEINRKRGGDDVFVSELVSDVVFKDIRSALPGGKAHADTVTILGIGRWNGKPATFEATATDQGKPGGDSDVITIKIFAGGQIVSTTTGTLRNGNIQSNRLPRR